MRDSGGLMRLLVNRFLILADLALPNRTRSSLRILTLLSEPAMLSDPLEIEQREHFLGHRLLELRYPGVFRRVPFGHSL